jgi:hypothetical protein
VRLEVRATEHPLSICRILNFGQCRTASMTGDFAAADRAIAHSIKVAARLNAPFWQVVRRFLKGELMVERRDFVVRHRAASHDAAHIQRS